MAFHQDTSRSTSLFSLEVTVCRWRSTGGVIIKRQDMKTTQEELDTMIVQQVAEVKAKQVFVVADDTDIYVATKNLF